MGDDVASELTSIWDEAKGHIDRGDYDSAIEIYKYILVRYDDDDIASEHTNAYLGDIFLTIRSLKLAEKYLKKAIGYAPEEAHYHYLLGFTYSVREHWARAVKEFKVAIRLDPRNGEYERGLGWAIFNGGDKADGLAHLYKAEELSPTDANVLTDLATAMLVMGNIDKAREYGEDAVRSDPGHVLAHKLLKNIDRIDRIRGKKA